MKRPLPVAAAFAAAALLPLIGCKSVDPPSTAPPSELNEQDSAAMTAAAQTYSAEILDALKSGNYAQFIRNFAPALQKQQGREKAFPEMSRKLGDIQGNAYLGRLDRQIFHTYLWKVQVLRPVKEADGKTTEKSFDLLMRITLAKLDGKYQIIDFQFN